MRTILILSTLFFLSLYVNAKDRGEGGTDRIKVVTIEKPATLSAEKIGYSFTGSPKTAILYRMKENIIRRALMFEPKKKWLKWS